MSIDIERILLELELLPKYDTQISLQTVEGETDHNYGTGKLTSISNHTEEEFVVFLFDMPYINAILKDLNMYRSRVMRLKSKTCYSYHQDPTKRIHIPLVTNPNCFMVIDDEVHRHPADGNHYLVDTTKIHTAVNASWEDRIHIIGCVNTYK